GTAGEGGGRLLGDGAGQRVQPGVEAHPQTALHIARQTVGLLQLADESRRFVEHQLLGGLHEALERLPLRRHVSSICERRPAIVPPKPSLDTLVRHTRPVFTRRFPSAASLTRHSPIPSGSGTSASAPTSTT